MGRRIWVISKASEIPDDRTDRIWIQSAAIMDAGTVVKFRRFLPKGPIRQDGVIVGDRPKSLVQVITDPGGIRTLTVASISFKDPRRARQQEEDE